MFACHHSVVQPCREESGVPAELKCGSVMVGHTVADEGRCDPARKFGADVVGRVQTALCLLLVVNALTQVLP